MEGVFMQRTTKLRKFNYYQVFLAVLLFSLIVSSCDKDEISVTDMFPMNVGNTWVYQQNSYIRGSVEENGEWISDYFLYNTSEFVQKIETYENIEGYTGYTIDRDGQVTTLLNLDNEGNVTQTQFFQNKFALSSILYKKYAKKGDSWTVKSVFDYRIDDYGIREIQYSCIASDTLIATFAGDFRCRGYRYRIPIPPSLGTIYYEEYFSENVGLVKRVHYSSTNAYIEYILKGYKLNPHR